MFYSLLSVIISIAALVLIYLALRFLARGHWLFGFLRGLLGLGLLAVAVAAVLVALDLRSYKQMAQEEPIATLSFNQLGEQHYEATLVHSSGQERDFELYGDQWQLDARIIRWQGPISGLGIRPGYRLDRISGRYYSLDDEQTGTRSLHDLSQSNWGVDIWAWVRQAKWMPLLEAQYGSATFVPMADNALYEVQLSGTGLTAKPLNGPAREALAIWE